jgi:kojibiose phosphorylase
MVMHPKLYNLEVQKENYHFYEPVCRHGSSLSPAMHAIVASRIGDVEEAYRYFLKSSTIDIFNTNEAIVGGTFIGGIHTAAAGALWQVMVNGFAGVDFEEDQITFNPGLPDEFDSLEFKLHYKNNIYKIFVGKDRIMIHSDANNKKDFQFKYEEAVYPIQPKENININR